MDEPICSGKLKILVLDDEPLITEALVVCFQEHLNCDVLTVRSSHEAVDLLQKKTFDVVIMDVYHPDLNGLKLTRPVKACFGSHVIIMTGYRETTPAEAEAAGADALFYKPVKLRTLLRAVELLLVSTAFDHSASALKAEGAVLLVDEVRVVL